MHIERNNLINPLLIQKSISVHHKTDMIGFRDNLTAQKLPESICWCAVLDPCSRLAAVFIRCGHAESTTEDEGSIYQGCLETR